VLAPYNWSSCTHEHRVCNLVHAQLLASLPRPTA
jgi:hypothetical protein